MTDPTTQPQPAPQDTPRRYLGAPVGGQAPELAAQGAMGRILAHIDDEELRVRLAGHKGGQFARAVANELDALHAVVANLGAQGQTPTLMTDSEATALDAWMRQHFAVTGYTPQAGDRLIRRVMMTLHAMYDQLQALQRALSERPTGGTPSG